MYELNSEVASLLSSVGGRRGCCQTPMPGQPQQWASGELELAVDRMASLDVDTAGVGLGPLRLLGRRRRRLRALGLVAASCMAGCRDPFGEHPLPAAPRPLFPGEVGRSDKHAAIIGWWSPLLHLLFFGRGWVRPDLGLARWLDLGQPDHDPVLRLVKRWWGTQVADMLAWAGQQDALRSIATEINSALHTTSQPARLPDRWADRRASPEWRGIWGTDYDGMHLSDHVVTPVSYNRDDPAHLLAVPTSDGPPRAVLMLSGYGGWYATLSAMGSALPTLPDGHAWRVDVIVRQLGWLGSTGARA